VFLQLLLFFLASNEKLIHTILIIYLGLTPQRYFFFLKRPREMHENGRRGGVFAMLATVFVQ
jgi:hypothetical protein